MLNPVEVLHGCLIGILTGIWAFLWTGPLSAGGPLGWVKRIVSSYAPEWLYKPLIGCAVCNSFWWATVVILRRDYCGHYIGLEILVVAIWMAYYLEKND